MRQVGLNSTLLEVSGTLEVFPRRTILLPATLLLPEVVPIRSTLQIGVEGGLDSGVVELVVAKFVSTHSLGWGGGVGVWKGGQGGGADFLPECRWKRILDACMCTHTDANEHYEACQLMPTR